jgi:prophage maintenance system killer protein
VSEPRHVPGFPDYDQAIAFHAILMERLGVQDPDAVDEPKLRSALNRSQAAAQNGRGDVVTVAAFLFFELIRGRAFGSRSTQTGIALMLAFLLRNGVAVSAENEEIAGVGRGIARGEVYTGVVEQWLRESVRRIQ